LHLDIFDQPGEIVFQCPCLGAGLTENGDDKQDRVHDAFRRGVEKRQERKLRARRQGDRGVWFGFGMFGLVGWAVTIPALLCIALGVWIDSRWPGGYSWTLMLLLVGVGLGCLNAWYWVSRERREIEEQLRNQSNEEREENHES